MWRAAALLFTPDLAAAAPGDATVPGYHAGPDRTDNYIVPGLTGKAAAQMHRDRAFAGAVSGPVYAQPCSGDNRKVAMERGPGWR